MIPIKQGSTGSEILVKVVARSSKCRVAGIMGDRLKVCVTSPPEKGRANAGVVETLAAHFGIARKRVRIVSGETTPLKKVRLEGMTSHQVREKLRGTSQADR